MTNNSHPVNDSFVFAAKGKLVGSEWWPSYLTTASTLAGRATKWLREWHQRNIVPGDDMDGLRQPSFITLINDIHIFQ